MSITPQRFLGKGRPPSPSWPWNVRTSLVVLWGVCWMFFDSPRFNDELNLNDHTDVDVAFDLNAPLGPYDPLEFDAYLFQQGTGKQ